MKRVDAIVTDMEWTAPVRSDVKIISHFTCLFNYLLFILLERYGGP
jgi:hypothetical protein